MGIPHFHLMWSLARSRFCYDTTSRALAKLHDRCPRSICVWRATEKRRCRSYNSWKWRIPVRHQWSRVLATDADRRTLSGQGEDQTAWRAPGGQDVQQPRRASSDQERAIQPWGHWQWPGGAEWLSVYLEGWEMFCARFTAFIIFTIHCHFMPF